MGDGAEGIFLWGWCKPPADGVFFDVPNATCEFLAGIETWKRGKRGGNVGNVGTDGMFPNSPGRVAPTSVTLSHPDEGRTGPSHFGDR